jgi:hypothetical protein
MLLTSDGDTIQLVMASAIAVLAIVITLLGIVIFSHGRRTSLSDDDLRRRKLQAYRQAWKIVSPLAIHNPIQDVRYSSIDGLSRDLSDWYVSWGIFINESARQRYFLLQDIIQIVLRFAEQTTGQAQRRDSWNLSNPLFEKVLRRCDLRVDSQDIRNAEMREGLPNHFSEMRVREASAKLTALAEKASKDVLNPDLDAHYVLVRYVAGHFRAALILEVLTHSPGSRSIQWGD